MSFPLSDVENQNTFLKSYGGSIQYRFLFILTSYLTAKTSFFFNWQTMSPNYFEILKCHQIQDSGNICPRLSFYHYDDDDGEDTILVP